MPAEVPKVKCGGLAFTGMAQKMPAGCHIFACTADESVLTTSYKRLCLQQKLLTMLKLTHGT